MDSLSDHLLVFLGFRYGYAQFRYGSIQCTDNIDTITIIVNDVEVSWLHNDGRIYGDPTYTYLIRLVEKMSNALMY
jgi:hypothetical protein